jgi:hypothetical protein
MSTYSQEQIHRLQHCIYRVFLHNPRLYYDKGAKICGAARNTFTKYWRDGLANEVFFPPQIRLNMYRNRKEYIYIVQTDEIDELYDYYRTHPDVIYLVYTIGKFDLLIMTWSPLKVVPNNTIQYGSRGNFIFPETPFCTYGTALDHAEVALERPHMPSSLSVEYPDEPELKGASYGLQIFPYLKYNLRPNYTFIVKKLGISFTSFYKGYEYLLNVSTVLLPYYPLGFLQYVQHFLVFWTDYEDLIREVFSYLPCHVSIVKVGDALLVYASVQQDWRVKRRFFNLCYKMLEMKLVKRYWTANPHFHWIPDL